MYRLVAEVVIIHKWFVLQAKVREGTVETEHGTSAIKVRLDIVCYTREGLLLFLPQVQTDSYSLGP